MESELTKRTIHDKNTLDEELNGSSTNNNQSRKNHNVSWLFNNEATNDSFTKSDRESNWTALKSQYFPRQQLPLLPVINSDVEIQNNGSCNIWYKMCIVVCVLIVYLAALLYFVNTVNGFQFNDVVGDNPTARQTKMKLFERIPVLITGWEKLKEKDRNKFNPSTWWRFNGIGTVDEDDPFRVTVKTQNGVTFVGPQPDSKHPIQYEIFVHYTQGAVDTVQLSKFRSYEINGTPVSVSRVDYDFCEF